MPLQKEMPEAVEVTKGRREEILHLSPTQDSCLRLQKTTVMNKFKSVMVSDDTLNSPPHTRNVTIKESPLRRPFPSVPPAPTLDPKNLTFSIRERHIRALGTVAGWSRTKTGAGQSPQETWDRRNYGVGELLHTPTPTTYTQPESSSLLFHLWEENIL